MIFENNDQNVSLAFRRMTALRQPPEDYLPDRPALERYQAFHNELKNNQQLFVENNQNFFEKLRLLYTSYFESYLGMEEECRQHYDDPHAKRTIRIEAFKELNDSSEIFKPLWVRKVLYKLKKDEFAKLDKYGRLIGDLGVGASLQGFRVTDFMKVAEAYEPLLENGIRIQFIKSPEQAALRSVFEFLQNPPERGYFCYFSDDSCFCIRINGIVYKFNIDISSCDSSHTHPVFKALIDSTPFIAQADMSALVDQLKLPIKIKSINNPHTSVYLTTTAPHLYSGSTLTTRINNFANQLIALSLSQHDFSTCSNAGDVEAAIITCARKVGYIVTCQPAKDYSHLQFLKHSPIYDVNGRLQPLLNLGVLLRTTGVCHRDLPGRGPLRERGRKFQQQLLSGFYPNVSFPLIDNMRKQCIGVDPTETEKKWIMHKLQPMLEYKVDTTAMEPFSLTTQELYRRYDSLHDYQCDELEHDLGNATFGTVIACAAASAILKMDYGLECTRS